MSLNRYEQGVFDYWERNPEERRHWQSKAMAAGKSATAPLDAARQLERELWDYLRERSEHVPSLRELKVLGGPRLSLQNLAEHIMRIWGPLPKPKPKRPPSDFV